MKSIFSWRASSPPPSPQNCSPWPSDGALALELDGLLVAQRRQPLLGPIDLRVGAGETVAVLGHSGSGKSTLLRAIVQLLPPGLTVQGTVRVGDVRVRPSLVPDLRRRTGMLRQVPVAFPGTAWDNVRLALEASGVPARPEEVEWWLSSCGLPRALWRRPAESLSGGERQRLALARCLARRPGLLLLDEPTSALDPVTAAELEVELAQLLAATTVLWVTHSPRQAARVARRAVVLWGGHVVGEGDPRSLAESGDPRVRALFAELGPLP